MKAINALVVPGTAETHMLENCRHLRGFRSSDVKRDSRRKQRRALRSELVSVVEQGMADVIATGAHLSLVPAEDSHELQRFAIRTVTVIRKRARQRTTVEQLGICITGSRIAKPVSSATPLLGRGFLFLACDVDVSLARRGRLKFTFSLNKPCVLTIGYRSKVELFCR